MNYEEKAMFEFAYNLVQNAGYKLKLEKQACAIEVSEKASHSDLVTNHDLMIDGYLSHAIKERYPQHAILSEESGANAGLGPDNYKWIIDPIDGTINYYRFNKNYAISVALYKNEEPVFGLIYDVCEERMYSGRKGECARCGQDLITYPAGKLNEAIVSMSLHTMIELSSMGMDVFDCLSRTQAYRYMGCASLELCKVAYGEIDLYLSSNVYEWDISAARVIVEQHGGIMIAQANNNKSRTGKFFVAAYHSPKLWDEVLGLFPGDIRNAYGY